MTTKNTQDSSGLQSGVTLIELLISITIGLVILLAIGLAYVNSTNITRQREDQAELNDPARMVMRILQHDISNAGYVDILDKDTTSLLPQAGTLFVPGDDTSFNLYLRATTLPVSTPLSRLFPGLPPIFGCDGAMSGTPNAISATAGPATLGCGTASATQQSLQVAYQAAPSAATTAFPSLLAPNAQGDGRDCNQQSLTAAPAGTASQPAREAKFVINRYFIRAAAGDGISELYCSGSGNATAQPMVRGVEEFVVRYQTAAPGTAPAAGANPIIVPNAQQQYASAATVAASSLGWANVTAVEICLVSATAVTGGAAAGGTATLQPKRPTCGRETSGGNIGNFKADITRATGDQRLWKRFTSVTTVRNAIFATPL